MLGQELQQAAINLPALYEGKVVRYINGSAARHKMPERVGQECEVLAVYETGVRVRFVSDEFITIVAEGNLQQTSLPWVPAPKTDAERFVAGAVVAEGRTQFDYCTSPASPALPCHRTLKAVPHDGKDDKGKSNPGLLFEGCAPALLAVTDVLDGGAKKYAANSWQNVPNGIERYKAAFYRHLQEMQVQGWDAVNHEDFGLLHIDHLITDLLFIRTLMHKEQNAI